MSAITGTTGAARSVRLLPLSTPTRTAAAPSLLSAPLGVSLLRFQARQASTSTPMYGTTPFAAVHGAQTSKTLSSSASTTGTSTTRATGTTGTAGSASNSTNATSTNSSNSSTSMASNSVEPKLHQRPTQASNQPVWLPFAPFDHYSTSESIYFRGHQNTGGGIQLTDEAKKVLTAPLPAADIDITPDGMVYLPVSKYKAILNTVFGPGGWALIPRGPTVITGRIVSREYALMAQGLFISQTRGEQMFFGDEGIATATEGARSSALSRCCKDLGIAAELWDKTFITKFKRDHTALVGVMQNNSKRMLWRRKDRKFEFPIREI